MPAKYYVKGKETEYTYDTLKSYMDDLSGTELAKYGLSKMVDLASDEIVENFMKVLCRSFANRMIYDYIPLFGPWFGRTLTALDLYEYSLQYMRWVKLEDYLKELEDGGTLKMRLDTYYWEAGSGNSYGYYSEWWYDPKN